MVMNFLFGTAVLLASILDAPSLERAVYEDSLSFSLSYSSIDFLVSNAGLDFRIDLETSGGYGFEFSPTENRRPSFSPDLILNVTMKRILGDW